MSNKTPEQRKAGKVKTLHHRKPVAIGGDRKNPKNLSWIPRDKHRAWHFLFGILTPQEIAQVINQKYLDPEFELIARLRK